MGKSSAQRIHTATQQEQSADHIQKVKHLLEQSRASNFDQRSLAFAQKAATLADQINFKKGKATALLYIGNHYLANGDSAKAVQNYQQSLSIANQLKDRESAAKALENLGILYGKLLSFPKSIHYYQQAINVVHQMNDQSLLAKLYGDCGRIFYQNLDFTKAFEYYQQSKIICEETGNKTEQIEILKKTGELYYHLQEYDKALECAANIILLSQATENKPKTAFGFAWRGNILMVLGKYKESLEQFEQSIQLRKQINDQEGLASDYANVAYAYQLLHDYETALKYHQESFAHTQKTKNKYTEMLYLKDMGILVQNAPESVLKKMGINPGNRYQTSIEYETKAMQLAEQIGDTPQKTYILEFMISAHEKLGNYQQAYSLAQQLEKLKYAMTGQQIKSEIARKDAQFLFEKKEAAEKVLQEKNKARIKFRFSVALFVFFITAITGFLLFYYTRMKKKKEKEIYRAHLQIMEMEKEKAESELNLAKLEMNNFIANLNEKNILIDKISEELLRLNHAFDEEKIQMQNTLNEIKNSVILTDDDWKIFLVRFEKIHPDFIRKIKSTHPKITAAELRYLMLIKIGLSNKEMADTLGVSLNTIHVTWKRLREKLGFSKEESPKDILREIDNSTIGEL